MRYRFGDFEFDAEELQLRRGDTIIPLEPKAYQVLDLLIRRRDRTVRKEELLQVVWHGAPVDEAAIRRTVRSLRRALGDEGNEETFISTRHGIGYRFVAEVHEHPRESPDVAPAVKQKQDSIPSGVPERYSFLRVASLLDVRRDPAAKISATPGLPAPVFLDDSYLMALAVRDHPRHLRALELSEWLQTESRPVVTSTHVLKRFVEACRDEGLGDAGDRLQTAVTGDPAIEIIPVSEELLTAVIETYWGAARQNLSAEDCIAFVVMKRRGASEALSDNPSFEGAGFRALLREPSRSMKSAVEPRNRFRGLLLYLLPVACLVPLIVIVAVERLGGEQSVVLRIMQVQPAATIGVPTAALIALCVTLFFQSTTEAQIRIEILGLRLSGPAAFLLVWMSCFLTIVLAVFLLWTGR
ncbi:MAG TPA: winged helix-turn-helix domain-containing protein [Bryobacteraceae bacterium]|nr:winged helix-turn-helix domain-containing protein [Bryobacteraceae bacterium]